MKYLLYLIVTLPLLLHAQTDASAVHKQIVQRFTASAALRIEAVSASAPGTKVSISAKRGNKFIIDMPDRTISCNGREVWNYTKEKKNVVVSAFQAGTTGLSVEKIFLDVVTKYKAVALQQQGSGKNTSYILRLQPNGETLYGVQSIVLTLDAKKKNIQRLHVHSDQGNQEWIIKSLQTNISIADTIFTFVVPKGVELIDMRE